MTDIVDELEFACMDGSRYHGPTNLEKRAAVEIRRLRTELDSCRKSQKKFMEDAAAATIRAAKAESELAAAQATISRKDEALREIAGDDRIGHHDECRCSHCVAVEALTLPADRTALDAMLAEGKSTGFTDGVKFCAAVLNAAGYFDAIKVIRQAAERSGE